VVCNSSRFYKRQAIGSIAINTGASIMSTPITLITRLFYFILIGGKEVVRTLSTASVDTT